MRSILRRTTRHLRRDATIANAHNRHVHARWSSTEGGYKWSTPLAKQLAEAITVGEDMDNT